MFRPQVAADMTRYLIAKIGGAPVDGVRMMKLLYLAEREALVEAGIHMCGGEITSMPEGPVVSGVYALANNTLLDDHWTRFVSYDKSAGGYSVKEDSSEFDHLSRYDESVLDRVHAAYGAMTREELVKLTHDLPEWPEKHGKKIGTPITDRAILEQAEGWSEEAIVRVEEEVEEEDAIAQGMKELLG